MILFIKFSKRFISYIWFHQELPLIHQFLGKFHSKAFSCLFPISYPYFSLNLNSTPFPFPTSILLIFIQVLTSFFEISFPLLMIDRYFLFFSFSHYEAYSKSFGMEGKILFRGLLKLFFFSLANQAPMEMNFSFVKECYGLLMVLLLLVRKKKEFANGGVLRRENC